MEKRLLKADKEIPGQRLALISFVSPEDILEDKDKYFFQRFVNNFEFEFRSKKLEEFLAKQVLDINNQLEEKASDLEKNNHLESAELCRKSKIRIDSLLNDLNQFVKNSASELTYNEIKDSYDNYVDENRKDLEETFNENNGFRTSIRGFKVRGVFANREEAAIYAKELIEEDDCADIHMTDVGKWVPWDPTVRQLKDFEYADAQLNTLIKMKQQNEEDKAKFFKERVAQAKLRNSQNGAQSGTNESVSSMGFPTQNETMFNSGDLALERKMNKKVD